MTTYGNEPRAPAAPAPPARPARARRHRHDGSAGRHHASGFDSGTTDTSTTDKAKDTASTAADQSKHVAGTAKDEAMNVAGTAAEQARNVVGDAKQQVTTQLNDQATTVATSSRRPSDARRRPAADGPRQGPDAGMATDLAREVSDRVRALGSHLESREPGQLLDDARDFARRRPGTFLLGALAAGVVAGRMFRATADGAAAASLADPGRHDGHHSARRTRPTRRSAPPAPGRVRWARHPGTGPDARRLRRA